ncbi:hypothetical protein P171DRAFT_488598 [Karstenula rhodostoma CBS 690.94]|uniref:Diphthamide biosynthesis protein 4 n=1 Tax=Karstenula rhodostoma CBS 690.94 TaxID=1392251 RepID=A0A9P4P9S4_9PLEO|nr:hypothetical protein P171DRAFT_488598 [Karstenula rhodostoma CBS 690.94]
MAFTQNYYTVLALPSPSSNTTPLTQATLRKAYKTALLAAHPDKSATPTPTTASAGKTGGGYTVDDVKEALAVLSDPVRRGAFERALGRGEVGGLGVGDKRGEGEADGDFILGLEVLDLSDFEAGLGGFVRLGTPEGDEGGLDFEDLKPPALGEGVEDSAEGDGGADADADAEERDEEVSGEEADQDQPEMEWTRPCRCGAEKGFGISERELEDAEARGEREVLVGCVGCSLWVRVGFEVEDG